MASPLRTAGAATLDQLAVAGRLWRLAASSARGAVVGPLRGERVRIAAIFEQLARVGNGSLPLVALIALLTGMILALQSAEQLRRFGALDLVADLVAVSITRELAPLLTAIIVAGRIGSAIAAELATMRVSEELDALTVMGIDPISFLVLPRLVALLIALPCLTLFADLVGILGGFAVGVLLLDLGATPYLLDSLAALTQQDLWGGMLKAVLFAGIIGLVGCQQGIDSRGGAEGVGRSTTAAVVRAIVLIIGADLFVTALLYAGG